MITNDTKFLLTALEGRDAREIAASLLVILIVSGMIWKIRQAFNQYVRSRLQHLEAETAEQQKLFSLIGTCETRICDLETRQSEDSDHALLYIQTLQEYIESLSRQIMQINHKLDSASLELIHQKEEANTTKINELRDRLLQGYRYYTSAQANPSLCWNEMEAEAFWAMFEDYERRGGDGYMHTDVEPAMRRLTIKKLFLDTDK